MTSHARHTALATQDSARIPGLLYPIVLVCVAAAAALVWYSPREIRTGAALAGGGMIVAAVARLVLSERAAGLLGCRHRYLDAVTLAALGLATVIVGLLLPPPG